MGKTSAPGNRSWTPGCAAIRCFVVNHVGANHWVLIAATPVSSRVVQDFLIHLLHQISVTFRASKNVGLVRSANLLRVTVDLESGSAAAYQTEITDNLVLAYPIKDPGCFWELAFVHSSIVRGYVKPVSRERQTTRLARRPASSPPHSAKSAVERLRIFTGVSRVSSISSFALANFDNILIFRMNRRTPVEPIATHIHETTARVLVRHERLNMLLCAVFGVRASHD